MSARKPVSWPLECESGWGGGKWPPASTESQRIESRRAAGPTRCSRKKHGRKSQRLGGAGRQAVSGPSGSQRWLASRPLMQTLLREHHPGSR